MKKGNIVKLKNNQLVKLIKINNDILIVKKVGINRGKNFEQIFGKYQGIGKQFEINSNQVLEII